MAANTQLKKHAQCAIILALFVLLAFWKIVFIPGYTYFSGLDLAGQYYPWYQFAGSSWKSGSPPLWDPYSRGGRAFYDEMQAGAFHPLNIVLFLLPAANGGVDVRTMDLFIVFSTILACWGEYALLRSIGIASAGAIIGGIIYGLAGYSAFIAGHQAIFVGLIWIPWTCLFFFKALQSQGWLRWRYCVFAGLFLGLTILAGHIQPPAHTCLMLGFFALWHVRRKGFAALAVLAGTVCFGILIAAVQLLPTYSYAADAYRWVAGVQLDPNQRVPFTLHEPWSPAESLSLLIPSSTSHMFYLGAGSLLLAIFGGLVSRNPYRGAMGLLAILTLLYSFGQLSALYALAYIALPFIEKVPEASRSFLMFHFAMAGLAGLGADVLSRPVESFARKRYVIVTNAVLFMSAGIIFVLIGVGLAKSLYVEPVKPQSYIALSSAAVLLILAAGLIALRRFNLLRLRTFAIAMVGLIAFDVVSFVQNHTPPKGTDSAETWYKPNPIIDYLKAQNGLFRVVDFDGVLPANFGDAYKLQSLFGYGATLRKDLFDFVNASPNRDDALRMLNVRYYVSAKPLPLPRVAFKDEKTGAAVYEDTAALPRVALVSREDASNNLRLGQRLREHGAAPGGEVRILSYEPQRIVIHTTAPESAYLWLSELKYPGWQAFVDGSRREVLVSDGILRAVDLDTGEHTVEFLFRPKAVLMGLAGTLAGLVLAVVVIAIPVDKNAATVRI